MKILLLEDDAVLADILKDYLSQDYDVSHAYTVDLARELCEEQRFDIYIFDINLPDGDGISFLKSLRAFDDFTPAILITAFQNIKYLKEAFKNGANDFIKKPFELEELSVRIDNIKAYKGLQQHVLIDKDISFDTVKNILHVNGKEFALNKKQSQMLRYLYKNRQRVISAQEPLQNLWSYDEMPTADAVRTLIKELRRYIGKEHIINIRSQGYKFEQFREKIILYVFVALYRLFIFICYAAWILVL